MKVLCYGVRDVELPFFEKLNENYNYELKCIPELLNDQTVLEAKGCQAVILRANCPANYKNLEIYKNLGVKYVLTRTVGYAHIDLQGAKDLGLKVAYVPFYSPNAIAELAVSLALMLARNTAYTTNNCKEGNFLIDASMFSKEIRKSTVGIIGLGKIGYTAATLFKGLGADVIGYDVFEKEGIEDVVKQVDLKTLLKTADIISLHLPFISGKNYRMVNDEFLSKVKKGAILVNTSRGELHDDEAIIRALESNKLKSFATDVFEGETAFFSKDMKDEKLDPVIKKLMNFYPRVLITPHIGSYTDEAVKNMVEVSYKNLKEFISTGKSENEL